LTTKNRPKSPKNRPKIDKNRQKCGQPVGHKIL
jgi:hypothetical protein